MIRAALLATAFVLALPAPPATAAPQDAMAPVVVPVPPPVVQVPLPAKATLPAMKFYSSVGAEEVLASLKANPMLAALDKELPGSPLSLIVTHTLRPTAGGQAAGLLSAMLSGGTLGLLPVVTNDRLVVRYEVMLNGKTLTTYNYERTATRAQNIWAGADGYGGLGKAGMEWLQSTATETADKLTRDPALLAVRDEIAFYFPAPATATAATGAAPATVPAAPAQ